MTNINVSTQTEPEPRNVALTLNELEAVSGGRKSSGNTASGGMFLTFTFKLVAVKTI